MHGKKTQWSGTNTTKIGKVAGKRGSEEEKERWRKNGLF
jgi:hypothetical protein